MTSNPLKWTKRQRSQLSAIRVPHKNDPPEMFPTAAEAWAAAKVWNDVEDDVDISTAPTQMRSTSYPGSLIAYWVETYGLLSACERIRRAFDDRTGDLKLGVCTYLRKYLFRADESTVKKAREILLTGLDDLDFWNRQIVAFIFDDKKLALSLVDEAVGKDLYKITDLLVCLPMHDALKVVESAEPVMMVYDRPFELVEAHGADAAPILEAIILRWTGTLSDRKKVDQALKLAQSGGVSAKVKAVEIKSAPSFVGWSAKDAHEDRYTKYVTVVVTGRFPGLTKGMIANRLKVREIYTRSGFGRANDLTYALFAGEGAKQSLLDEAAKRGVNVLGAAELSTLLATPLFGYRERVEKIVKDLLERGSYDVRQWYIGPPATEREIDEAEARLGVHLDPALRSLYAQCNGLFLNAEWTPGFSDFGNQQIKAGGDRLMPMFVANEKATARQTLAVPSLADLHAMGTHEIGSERIMKIGRPSLSITEKDFLNQAYMLDYWFEYYPVIVFLDGENPGRVLYGHDHGASFETGQESSVEDYFEVAMENNFSTRTVGNAYLERWWD